MSELDSKPYLQDFEDTFQEMGKENENIKAIGILLETIPVMELEEDYTRNYYEKECIRIHVLTERVPYKCWDWPLGKKIRRDPRVHRLQNQYKIPVIIDIVSGTEAVPRVGDEMTKGDIENYLYGEHPLNPNFKILYPLETSLPSNQDS